MPKAEMITIKDNLQEKRNSETGELLAKLDYLKINGTEEEKKEFEKFKKTIFEKVNDKEFEKLKEFSEHYLLHLAHSVMVAWDTKHIAKQINENDEKTYEINEDKVLKAAILHDIGKLKIIKDVLDLGGAAEEEKIWQKAHPDEEPTKKITIFDITLNDTIDYKNYEGEIDVSEEFLKQNNVSDPRELTIRQYLNYHQVATEEVLKSIESDSEVTKMASTHHPEYLSKEERESIPKESRILDVVDKFNAITQSEGMRRYFSAISRTVALDMITKGLKREFGALPEESVEKKTLQVLIGQYLEKDVSEVEIPLIKSTIDAIKNNLDGEPQAFKEKADKAIGLISTIFSLSKEFGQAIDEHTTLQEYRDELKKYINQL